MAQECNSRTLKGRMRQIAKSLAIKSGALGLYHRVKHREVLTVLMFHRLLPQDLISVYGADEGYTISTELFEELVEFVAVHYTIVSLGDVLGSRKGKAPLPKRPLLITFDDGWDDNAVFAAPILMRMNVPWTLFVATGAPDAGSHWWQETLLAALRSGSADYEVLKSAALRATQQEFPTLPDDQALSVLVLYGALPPAERDRLIATYCGNSAATQRPRDMASWETLKALHEGGVSIGAHGTSHLPLTVVEDPEREISQSKTELEKRLGAEAGITMSFPHGLYNASLVETAHKNGLKLLFTSEPVLNRCSGGWLESDLVGRISISTTDVAGPTGMLRPDRLMPWLMLRRQAAM
jgi:peptidoglycan/xylan/chitin deacetylase (PgdA/CDA1 family)